MRLKNMLKILAGIFIGGFIGWVTGVAWYELVDVPKAASMDPMTAASYLCAAGSYEPLIMAGLGVIVGAIAGVLGAIVGALKDQADISVESQDHPQ